MNAMRLIRRTLTAFILFTSLSAFSETTTIDDSVITTKVKSKIALDQSLSVFDIGVTTNNGVVTLDGNVQSAKDASTAIEIAESVDGVTDVDASSLHIKENKPDNRTPITDTFITAKIKGLFLKNKLFNSDNDTAITIKVETINGNVRLTGYANNQTQVDNAIKIAKSVDGVKSVNANVRIRPNNR